MKFAKGLSFEYKVDYEADVGGTLMQVLNISMDYDLESGLKDKAGAESLGRFASYDESLEKEINNLADVVKGMALEDTDSLKPKQKQKMFNTLQDLKLC